ncbi:kunitz trypsin inhibitor 1 [Raphanus sativus]|nr:kunitz trypsin inhibitor 1 [Raphanus sativus]
MDVKATICVQSTYWWVTAAPSHFRTLFITAGPNPEAGEDSSRSFFKIEKTKGFPGGYQIVSCPNGNDCINVGIINDEYGVRRLALTSTPFSFVFMKADETETYPKTMSII